ncbi:hypothetical protein MPTK1_4g16260 [Marchantia polymorpha subsp. ruderalis]|uniref:Uncharacterized protein n=2 Tax=Marchantia polymorpha TaxID=3197 RepID=A0AAF6BAG2_MARPO|nr:hypothetical protein MARPO_0054s0091 [Marchantia polymorpha]BBN08996.1 hypothetical protein Mp_4g16260 [Marchantia polymorpha subsp. ruderalis]|eukprot:PTQ37984.1 hypothetical protein MARPO_0054s0091 [Marchantia polymorpha]
MLALALKPLHEAYENKVSSLQGYENKVRFLQAYEPGPLSESFRGDVSFIGTDLEPVYAHRFIMVITAPALAGLRFSLGNCFVSPFFGHWHLFDEVPSLGRESIPDV